MQDKEVKKTATRYSQEWVTKAKDTEVETRAMFKSGNKQKFKTNLIAFSIT